MPSADAPRTLDVAVEARLTQRWRGAALRWTLAGLAFATGTGSLLIFFGLYLPNQDPVGLLHWVAAAVAVPVWAVYLLRHWLRVRRGGRPVHYYVGLTVFFTLLATTLTGIPLIFPDFLPRAQSAIDLAHIIAGFIVMILLTAHLVLVTRIAGGGGPAVQGAVRTTLTWITTGATIAAFAAGIWLAL